MASLAAILRKSASFMVAPLSLRFISTGAKNQGSLFFPSKRASTALLQGPSSVPRYYSSIASPKRPASDEAFLRLLNSEIKCKEEQIDDRTGEVPNGFPFKIEHGRYRHFSLTGNYHNETIILENFYVKRHTTTSESDGSDEEKGNGFSISLSVSVIKENGSYLQFCCTGFPDKMTVDAFSTSSEDRANESHTNLSELDNEVQKALTKYLEMRGINTATISFLYQYTMNKYGKEFKKGGLIGLKNLKKFLEA